MGTEGSLLSKNEPITVLGSRVWGFHSHANYANEIIISQNLVNIVILGGQLY